MREINVKLLKQIQAEIRKEPRRMDMDSWVDAYASKRGANNPPCGTTACIAGFAVMLTKGDPDLRTFKAKIKDLKAREFEGVDFQKDAKNALRLNADQMTILFFVSHWPKDLEQRYNAAIGKERGEVAIERIERFIKTKGEE